MSNQNSILLLDPSFDPVSATDCTLLLNIGLDNISYAIINNTTKHIYVVFDEQECEDPFRKITAHLKTSPHLGLSFKETKVLVHTENKINIPNALYTDTDLSIHTPFFPGVHAHRIYVNPQPRFDLTTIFSLPKPLDDLLDQHFADAQLFAGLLAIVPANSLTLTFTAGSFNLIYTQQQQLVFEQAYEILDSDEFNYYLLLVINQLAINTQETMVYVGGIIDEEDQRYQCLSKYFSHLAFLEVDPQLQQEIIEDLPSHYYVNLLALNQCE